MDTDSFSLLPFFFGTIFLVLAGSVLSMLKTALASLREARLHSLIEAGQEKYRRVLDAAERYAFYLTSLRIASLFFEVSAGCLGAFGFSVPLEKALSSAGISPGAAGTLSILIIACGITISFFILGEVFLRQLALVFPEVLSAALFPLIRLSAVLVFPLFWAGQSISSFMKKILSANINRRGMTEAELRLALLEGEKSGVVETEERTMVEGVFYLGDRPVSAFMTHRSEIQWLNIDADGTEARTAAENSGDQLFIPVARGDLDEVVGMVSVLDIFRTLLKDPWPGLKSIIRSPYFIPETMSALKAFEAFKKAEANYLFVMDEYGGFAGILTVRSLIEEIVGEFSASSKEEETIAKQEDGSWLADGGVSIDDAAAELELIQLGAEQSEYYTLAGFILYLAGEIPKTGEYFDYNGYRFKIVDMDGNRIDKIMITKISSQT